MKKGLRDMETIKGKRKSNKHTKNKQTKTRPS